MLGEQYFKNPAGSLVKFDREGFASAMPPAEFPPAA